MRRIEESRNARTIGSASLLQCDNPFWSFSLDVYAAPGVAAECLALQRELDVDVNMLLFCAWLGAAHGSVLTAERVGLFESLVRPWHEDVVKPLRGVRDTLKSRADFVETDIGALRGRVLSVELDAERIEQALLYQAALPSMPEAAPHAAADAMRANILTYLQSKARAAHRGDPALPATLLAAAAEAVVQHEGIKNL
jgi:uncharacterized protein (TIGR02444 family)